MYPEMSIHIGLVGKAAIALMASVRFLVRVGSLVNFQDAFESKSLVAKFAK